MLFKYHNATLEFKKDDNRYVVKSGSAISTAYNIDSRAASAAKRRHRVDNARNIARRMGWNGEQVLKHDISFRSASSAADFVAGDWRSGTQVWKNSKGQTLGEHKNSNRLSDAPPSLYDKILLDISSGADDDVTDKFMTEDSLDKVIDTLERLSTDLPPKRIEYIVSKVARKPNIAQLIKKRQEYICEVCGLAPFIQKNGKPYAEADHIKPLGGAYGGLDAPENMRCLCAQCHAVITHGSNEAVRGLLKGTKWQS